MGSQTTERSSMSFRDSVKDNTKSVMIQTFITSLFADPNMRFGDILEDLIENDDPDDDWMRETLYDLEIGQLVKAGMKVMGLASEDTFIMHTEDVDFNDGATTETGDGTKYNIADDGINGEEEVGPAPPPRRKKKKKKKKAKNSTETASRNSTETAPKKKKKKKKKTPPPPDKKSRDTQESEVHPEWKDYLKLIVKAMRTHKAYDEDAAVNNAVILNDIHGEGNWEKDESADLRRGIEDLVTNDKVSKVGQRRGTRYHLAR